MLTIPVYERVTRNYRDGWKYLDHEEFVGNVRVTPPRLVREPDAEDFGDEGTYIMHARTAPGSPNIREALHDTFSGTNCRHEYDCCGCIFRHARVRKVGPRDYVIRQTVSRNY